MADAEWISNITKIVKQSIVSDVPCDIIPGTVVSADPLQIKIDQKITLSGTQLLPTVNVADKETEMDIPGMGFIKVKVCNGLKDGEQVILLQKPGGQQYVVLDRWPGFAQD